MCAIIGWSGKMPAGLIDELLLNAEHRGRDSTGIAYWSQESGHSWMVKHAISAKTFVKVNAEYLKSAHQSQFGIAHTRRASPKMPIDNDNAHPFNFGSYVFAHNGAIRNWRELKEELISHYSSLDNERRKLAYAKKITTDSMVLGPAIEELNFANVVGAMGLVWMRGRKVFAMRSKKELTSANIIWSPKDSQEEVHNLTVVASTWDIICKAIDKASDLAKVTYDMVESVMDENTLYQLSPGEVSNEGPVLVSEHNTADAHSSKED